MDKSREQQRASRRGTATSAHVHGVRRAGAGYAAVLVLLGGCGWILGDGVGVASGYGIYAGVVFGLSRGAARRTFSTLAFLAVVLGPLVGILASWTLGVESATLARRLLRTIAGLGGLWPAAEALQRLRAAA